MPLFKNRVLQSLDRIYKIVGKQAPNSIETSPPITLVHDVSREAGLGAGLGNHYGYFWDDHEISAAMAGTEWDWETPGSRIESGFIFEEAPPSLDSLWLWHIACGISSDLAVGTQLTGVRVALTWPPGESGMDGRRLFPLLVAEGVTAFGDAGTLGGDANVAFNNGAAEDFFYYYDRPVPMAIHSTYTIRTTWSGSGSQYFWHLNWIGPRGVTPPGMR